MSGLSRTTTPKTPAVEQESSIATPAVGPSNADAQAALADHAGHDHGTPALDAAKAQLPTPPGKDKRGASPTVAGAGTAAAGAAVAGGGDVVLSVDPKYASKGYVAWFAGQLKAKFDPWGLAFDASAVKLAADVGTKGTSGIVLTWNAAWGAKPSTSPIPLTMAPVDAKVGVTAVQALSGWATVEASNKTRVSALLAGETNKLSAAARDKFRPEFATVKAKGDAEQASALEALLTDKAAKPVVINSKNEGAASAYTLTGPTEKKAYAFRGKAADAEEWACTFDDGQVIPIIAPKAPEAGHHYHTVAQAAEAASFLPAQSRKVVTSIVLNVVENPDDPGWAVKYNRPDFHSYMTAGVSGQITIYPDDAKAVSGMEAMKGSMVHETGHTWSYKTWGTDTTKGRWVDWKKAMDADKTAISSYGMSSIAEDVAETVQVYASTQGSPKFDEYKAIVPERFKVLAADYK